MKAVKFLMPHTVGALYNTGEIAGFSDAIADDLVKREIAELVKSPPKGKPSPEDKARTDLESLSDEDLDKLVTDEKVAVAEDADRAAKIEAILATRKK